MDFGIGYAILSMIGFGSYMVFGRDFIRKYGFLAANFYLHFFAVIIIGIAFSQTLIKSVTIAGLEQVIPLILLSGFVGALAVFMLFYALEVGNLVTVIPLGNLGGFFSLLLSIKLLGEQYNSTVIIGAIIVLAGVIFSTVNFSELPPPKQIRMRSLHSLLIPGASLALAFSAVNSLYGVASKIVVSKIGGLQSAFFMELSVWIFVAIISIGTVAAKGFGMLKLSRQDVKPLLLTGALLALGAGAAYLAIEDAGLGMTGAIIQAAPVVGVLLAVLWLKEKINWFQKFGIALVMLGLAIIFL